MMLPRSYRLPDPYWPLYPIFDGHGIDVNQMAFSGTALTANQAYYCPVIFPASATLYAMYFEVVSGTTGNYDIGLYDSACSARLVSAGSTAVSAIGVKTFTFTAPIRVHAGDLLYTGIVLSSGTPTVRCNSAGSAQVFVALNLGIETSALPLPTTATPVKTTSTVNPVIVFGVE